MTTTKVAYNVCFGGFGLSKAADKWLEDNYNLTNEEIYELSRHDKRLIECIEALGEAVSDQCAKIKITEIAGKTYYIDEYDGREGVVTPEQFSSNWITAD